jgi:hypothetical protein
LSNIDIDIDGRDCTGNRSEAQRLRDLVPKTPQERTTDAALKLSSAYIDTIDHELQLITVYDSIPLSEREWHGLASILVGGAILRAAARGCQRRASVIASL